MSDSICLYNSPSLTNEVCEEPLCLFQKFPFKMKSNNYITSWKNECTFYSVPLTKLIQIEIFNIIFYYIFFLQRVYFLINVVFISCNTIVTFSIKFISLSSFYEAYIFNMEIFLSFFNGYEIKNYFFIT